MIRIVAAAFQRTARTAALALLVTALGGCAWLDTKQREIALRPTPSSPADALLREKAARPSDEHFHLPSPDAPGQQVALWWLPHADARAPSLLYLHGTYRNLAGNLPKIEALREAGFAILAVDYRGWGESTPIVPSEASIHSDALVAWAELQRRQPDARQRVIYGHSMGGAAAVRLASTLKARTDYAALVLESTFTRMPDVAAMAGAWGRLAASLTNLEFDSLSRIGRIDAPLLIVHGDADRTVPVALGRRLRDAAPAGVQWLEVPGGSHSRLHSDAPALYQGTLREFMAQLAPVPQ